MADQANNDTHFERAMDDLLLSRSVENMTNADPSIADMNGNVDSIPFETITDDDQSAEQVPSHDALLEGILSGVSAGQAPIDGALLEGMMIDDRSLEELANDTSRLDEVLNESTSGAVGTHVSPDEQSAMQPDDFQPSDQPPQQPADPQSSDQPPQQPANSMLPTLAADRQPYEFLNHPSFFNPLPWTPHPLFWNAANVIGYHEPGEPHRLNPQDPADVTSYHSGQSSLTEHNLMDLMRSGAPNLDFYNAAHNRVSGRVHDMSIDGVVQTFSYKNNQFPIRDLPTLPRFISTHTERWRIEFWLRVDPRIRMMDIMSRMAGAPNTNFVKSDLRRLYDRQIRWRRQQTPPLESWRNRDSRPDDSSSVESSWTAANPYQWYCRQLNQQMLGSRFPNYIPLSFTNDVSPFSVLKNHPHVPDTVPDLVNAPYSYVSLLPGGTIVPIGPLEPSQLCETADGLPFQAPLNTEDGFQPHADRSLVLTLPNIEEELQIPIAEGVETTEEPSYQQLVSEFLALDDDWSDNDTISVSTGSGADA